MGMRGGGRRGKTASLGRGVRGLGNRKSVLSEEKLGKRECRGGVGLSWPSAERKGGQKGRSTGIVGGEKEKKGGGCVHLLESLDGGRWGPGKKIGGKK